MLTDQYDINYKPCSYDDLSIVYSAVVSHDTKLGAYPVILRGIASDFYCTS